MSDLDLTHLRHELNQLAHRGQPILATDLAGAILDVYGPEVAERVDEMENSRA